MARYEADVVIIGGGITAAMVAEKLFELRPNWSVIVVEAGKRLFDFENRFEYRQRSLDYGENQWPGDFVADQGARGLISRTMAVGGSALHWGGVCNRFSEEDTRLKSMYGLAVDWPVEWKELERFYCEAERRLGVSGEPSPLPEDWRSEPYPMPAMTMSYNLKQLKSWAEQSGIKFWTTPQAKNTVEGYGGRGRCRRCNTCEICPTGARYSPDWTFKQLLAAKKIQLHDQTLVRKLVLDEKTTRIATAQAAREDGTDNNVEYRARTFILASGYCWSPHLLLLSANPRFPNGLANSSDHVGRLHDRPPRVSDDDRSRPEDLSGHERSAQPDLAAVLPKPSGSAVRAPRPSCLGERRRPRTAAARCRGQAAARRRADGRLAKAHDSRDRARARLFRCPSRSRQPADARRRGEEPVGRRDAGDSASDRRRVAGPSGRHARTSSERCLRNWPRPTTAGWGT